jgi:hypothetical protein
MISVGCTRRTAAALLGSNESTFRSAWQRDETFAEDLQKAERQRELVPLRNLQMAGQKYWRAAAWYLERLRPHEYASRKPAVVTEAQMNELIEFVMAKVLQRITSRDDRLAIAAELEKTLESARREEQPWQIAQPARRSRPKSRTTKVPHIGPRENSSDIRAPHTPAAAPNTSPPGPTAP